MSDLAEGKGPNVIGVGGAAVRPLGYVIVNLQVEAAESYNEDQIALIIPDASAFTARAPMIIGTCTLNQIVEAMKESELDNLTPTVGIDPILTRPSGSRWESHMEDCRSHLSGWYSGGSRRSVACV